MTSRVIVGDLKVSVYLILHSCYIQAGDNTCMNQAVISAGETES